MATWMAISISKGLSRAVNLADAVAIGDLSKSIDASSSDEIGEVHASNDDIEGAQVLRALDRVLDRMPSRRRMAFVLRHVQGCEVSEAAAMLGVSESTVKREARRARASIELRAAQSGPWLWDYLRRMETASDD